MDKIFDFILKVIDALKPRFYSKLTWFIVAFGLSLMSKPLWLEILNKLFEAQLQLSITDGSDSVWGFALCCLGLTYHLMSTGLDEIAVSINSKARLEKEYTHDLKVFGELYALLEEPYLENLLAGIETNDSIYYNELNKITAFIETAQSSNKSFISTKLQSVTADLVMSLLEFRKLVNDDFDEFPYGQCVVNFRMCLAPELNPDRAGSMEERDKYVKLINIMLEKTNQISVNYNAWRKTVKELLFV